MHSDKTTEIHTHSWPESGLLGWILEEMERLTGELILRLEEIEERDLGRYFISREEMMDDRLGGLYPGLWGVEEE